MSNIFVRKGLSVPEVMILRVETNPNGMTPEEKEWVRIMREEVDWSKEEDLLRRIDLAAAKWGIGHHAMSNVRFELSRLEADVITAVVGVLQDFLKTQFAKSRPSENARYQPVEGYEVVIAPIVQRDGVLFHQLSVFTSDTDNPVASVVIGQDVKTSRQAVVGFRPISYSQIAETSAITNGLLRYLIPRLTQLLREDV